MPDNNPRIILHVDMDYFFAQCEERERPELKGKPVVICVYSGRTEDSGAVSTSNYEARRLGVKAGIPISRAKKLAPEAEFLPVNMELYRSISDEVMEILKGHCLTLEQESVDEAFCVQKPDGSTVVNPEEVTRFLAPLKITDLTGVGKKTGERLNELGVKTIGELSGMPAEELIREFGQAKGAWLKQASQGIDYSEVEEREGTEQIGRITTLKQDTSELNIIFNAINQLSEDVHRKLEERNLGFKSIRNTGFELAKAFLAEHQVLLRRVGVRVSNLIEEMGQKTLMEF